MYVVLLVTLLASFVALPGFTQELTGSWRNPTTEDDGEIWLRVYLGLNLDRTRTFLWEQEVTQEGVHYLTRWRGTWDLRDDLTLYFQEQEFYIAGQLQESDYSPRSYSGRYKLTEDTLDLTLQDDEGESLDVSLVRVLVQDFTGSWRNALDEYGDIWMWVDFLADRTFLQETEAISAEGNHSLWRWRGTWDFTDVFTVNYKEFEAYWNGQLEDGTLPPQSYAGPYKLTENTLDFELEDDWGETVFTRNLVRVVQDPAPSPDLFGGWRNIELEEEQSYVLTMDFRDDGTFTMQQIADWSDYFVWTWTGTWAVQEGTLFLNYEWADGTSNGEPLEGNFRENTRKRSHEGVYEVIEDDLYIVVEAITEKGAILTLALQRDHDVGTGVEAIGWGGVKEMHNR